MKTSSTIKPNQYQIRYIENGIAFIRLFHHIEEKQVVEDDKTQFLYEYEEFDIELADRDNIERFITDNFDTLWNNALDRYKKEKINSLNQQCNEAILKGFAASNGHFYEFDYEAQGNFNQQLSILLLDSTATDIDWKTEDVGVLTHTRDDFIQIAKVDAQNHKRNNIGKYWTLKANTLSALDKTTVDNIVW